MEVWISMIFLAISIVLGAIIGGYQISKAAERTVKEVAREMSEHIGKAIEAIHVDIKHSQEKLERKIEK